MNAGNDEYSRHLYAKTQNHFNYSLQAKEYEIRLNIPLFQVTNISFIIIFVLQILHTMIQE